MRSASSCARARSTSPPADVRSMPPISVPWLDPDRAGDEALVRTCASTQPPARERSPSPALGRSRMGGSRGLPVPGRRARDVRSPRQALEPPPRLLVGAEQVDDRVDRAGAGLDVGDVGIAVHHPRLGADQAKELVAADQASRLDAFSFAHPGGRSDCFPSARVTGRCAGGWMGEGCCSEAAVTAACCARSATATTSWRASAGSKGSPARASRSPTSAPARWIHTRSTSVGRAWLAAGGYTSRTAEMPSSAAPTGLSSTSPGTSCAPSACACRRASATTHSA